VITRGKPYSEGKGRDTCGSGVKHVEARQGRDLQSKGEGKDDLAGEVGTFRKSHGGMRRSQKGRGDIFQSKGGGRKLTGEGEKGKEITRN